MKKLLALILAVLMLAAVLAACGEQTTTPTAAPSGDGGGETVDDPFYGEDNISLLVWAPEAAVELTQKLCNDFIALYPDKTITIDVKPQEEGDAATQVLNDPEVAADVFSFAVDQLNKLDKAKVLSPLNDYIDDVTARDSEASVKAATLNGELLAYPETGENGYYLVYDKAVVSDEDAKTFEGVLEACRKAGKKFNMDAGNGFYSCMFVFTGGLKLTGLNEDGGQLFNDTDDDYDEEKVLDTLQAFNKLFTDYADVFQSDNVDKTGSGLAQSPRTVAAGIDGSWNAKTVGGLLGDDYGAVKLPTININGTDTQIVSMNGYKLLGVNDYSDFPEASHVLANYLAGEDCQKIRAEQLSWSPSNKAIAATDLVASNKGTVACLEQANYSLPQVNIADTFWSPMGTLGAYLYKNGLLTRDQIKTEYEKTITNIKDE